MFFNINTGRSTHNMSLHFANYPWCVSTDAGWQTFEAFNDGVRTLFIANGYCDTMGLRDAALHANTHTLSGNFCVIKLTTGRVTVLHNHNRNFPLWHCVNYNTLSNMPKAEVKVPFIEEAVLQEIDGDVIVSLTPGAIELTKISHLG